MTLPLAIFRVDASMRHSLGHFMRCRALAGRWVSEGGRAIFATTETPDALLGRMHGEGVEVHTGPSNGSTSQELNWLRSLVRDERPQALVLDGYGFEAGYQTSIKSSVPCLVILDDVPGRQLDCHVVLNQNLGVSIEDYRPLVSPGTIVLAGPRYALLRQEFAMVAGSYRMPTHPRRVFVTLGGADARDRTARVLAELAQVPDLEIDLALGMLYPHSDPVNRVCRDHAGRIHVHKGLESLLDLERRADLAVTAGGSTVWELACLGVPMVVLGTAENQEAVLRGLKEARAARVLGWADSLAPGEIGRAVRALLAAPAQLEELSRAAMRLVDGKGAERVAKVITEVCERAGTCAGTPTGASDS